MKSLNLFLSGALVPNAWLKLPEMAAAFERSLLGTLLAESRVVSQRSEVSAVPSSTLFEQAIAQVHGLGATQVGALSGFLDNIKPGAWRIDPIVLRVALDHLVLGAADEAVLTKHEADALCHCVGPLFFEQGGLLIQGTPNRWYWEDAGPLKLNTPSLEAARGRNIEAYNPSGADARQWRRLLNELQMTWFAHEVNAEREQRGELPINGVWISGPVSTPNTRPFDAYRGNTDGIAAALAIACAKPLYAEPRQGLEEPNNAQRQAYLSEDLLGARQTEDLSLWLKQFALLSTELEPALQQARARKAKIEIVLAGESNLVELAWEPRRPWHFFRTFGTVQTLADGPT
jgi:hypothetical protein